MEDRCVVMGMRWKMQLKRRSRDVLVGLFILGRLGTGISEEVEHQLLTKVNNSGLLLQHIPRLDI
jgi:hypothetical protein